MSDAVSGLLTIALLVALLAVAYHPLGAWMARVFTDTRHWRVERLVYRMVRVDPDSQQGWRAYATSVLAFSVVGIVALFALVVAQTHLPLRQGAAGMGVTTAVNTAISFVTNTNWQSYAGEVGATPVLQALGLTVQNFVSAAVGLAVVVALVRALTRQAGHDLGNFWVDLVRGVVRVLLPLSFVAAVVLLAGGVVQNLTAPTTVTGPSGAHQVIRGGLVASQEAIKELGTNGGGYFSANSAHPFENPNAVTSLLEVFLLMVRARTALLAAVSHDLRTPLASIKAAASSLRQPDVVFGEADRADLLETIEESTDRLTGLVTNLLDMSRLQSGAVVPRTGPVLLDAAVATAAATLPEGSRVRLTADPAMPAALADPGLLDRVLANVLENALRHSTGEVVVALSATADRVLLRVVDRGVGVPEGAKEAIFAPFQRYGDAPRGTGVGLGLAVARGLVEAMGGTIGAEDTPGGGLTVVLELPRSHDDGGPGGGAEPAGSGADRMGV